MDDRKLFFFDPSKMESWIFPIKHLHDAIFCPDHLIASELTGRLKGLSFEFVKVQDLTELSV